MIFQPQGQREFLGVGQMKKVSVAGASPAVALGEERLTRLWRCGQLGETHLYQVEYCGSGHGWPQAIW